MEPGEVCLWPLDQNLGWSAARAGSRPDGGVFVHGPRGEALTIASDLIQGSLLLVATAAFLPNTSRSRCPSLHIRLFWILMSVGMLFWLTYQGMWNYFEVFKRQEVPNPFLGDIVLFLHLVPMIAALAVLPHLREDERDERIRMLDFTLLLTWWVFIYVYAVIPWQTVQVDEAAYSANFNFAYLTEKLVLLVALAILAYTAHGGWRQLYGQLLGASALYASSSYVANWAIGHKLYYSGSIYDIPLTFPWLGWARLRCSPSARPVRLQAVAAGARHLDHAPEYAGSVQHALGAMHAELDPELPAFGQGLPHYRESVDHGRDGRRGFLAAAPAPGPSFRCFWKGPPLFRRPQGLAGKAHSIRETGLARPVGGRSRPRDQQPAHRHAGILRSAERVQPADQEQLQAAQIGEQVRRTTTLVASLLTFAGQAPARLAAVDINSVLQTAVRLLAPQLEAQGSSIRLDLASPLPLVLADSNQILHVCMHLAGQISAPSQSREPTPPCSFAPTANGDVVWLTSVLAILLRFFLCTTVIPASRAAQLRRREQAFHAFAERLLPHRRRTWRPSPAAFDSRQLAFRMELRIATNPASRSTGCDPTGPRHGAVRRRAGSKVSRLQSFKVSKLSRRRLRGP
jgi:hypothetical protein